MKTVTAEVAKLRLASILSKFKTGKMSEDEASKRLSDLRSRAPSTIQIPEIDELRTETRPEMDRTRSGNTFHKGTLEYGMAQYLIGQDEAISAVCDVVYTYQTGINRPRRPIGSILLLGPTGVGKTKTVETLAQVLHGSPDSLIRLDCAEYALNQNTARLTGAPPGYVGFETKPVITQERLNDVKSQYSGLSIVLFDEIEKGSRELFNLLLGILDYGTLTIGSNKGVEPINFDSTIIFMTANVGVKEVERLTQRFGFAKNGPKGGPAKKSSIARTTNISLEKTFSPEFLNRISRRIMYKDLDEEQVEQIFRLQVAELNDLLRKRQMGRSNVVSFSKAAQKFLISEGVSPKYGARELSRVMDQHVRYPLARGLAWGQIGQGEALKVEINSTADGVELLAAA